ncbi:serine hydrolase domain-containing protein [Streptosporangium vulgare]|uniref:Serine hydrolase n=1 Tax=Streptosporangium vulgare TaxID=46190 RepID=A0ABV5TKW3_9ACTN
MLEDVAVDVWLGTADQGGTRPWRRDTVVNVFSVSKGVVATVALLCARRGLVDLDAPVARYRPGFTAEATVAELLSHRAGLPAIRSPLPPGSLYDWDAMAGALAAEEPRWTPGSGTDTTRSRSAGWSASCSAGSPEGRSATWSPRSRASPISRSGFPGRTRTGRPSCSRRKALPCRPRPSPAPDPGGAIRLPVNGPPGRGARRGPRPVRSPRAVPRALPGPDRAGRADPRPRGSK